MKKDGKKCYRSLPRDRQTDDSALFAFCERREETGLSNKAKTGGGEKAKEETDRQTDSEGETDGRSVMVQSCTVAHSSACKSNKRFIARPTCSVSPLAVYHSFNSSSFSLFFSSLFSSLLSFNSRLTDRPIHLHTALHVDGGKSLFLPRHSVQLDLCLFSFFLLLSSIPSTSPLSFSDAASTLQSHRHRN